MIKSTLILILSMPLFLMADGYFISIGNGSHRMYSKDGINWEAHEFTGKPGHDQNDLKAIAHGNGVTVVVGGFLNPQFYLLKTERNGKL